MEHTPLSELLGNADAATGEPEAVEEQAVDDEQPRDEHGRFASLETGVEPEQGQPEPEAVPPTAGLPQEEYKAIREEREKRKRLEAELEALRQQMASQPPEPPPSIWEDDQGALQHVKQEAVSLAVQQATLNAKLDMSEMMVRQQNPDFDEVKAEFLALAEQNPGLVQQALADPHPWDKAYKIAKTHRTMQELGATDVATLRAKLREEVLAELQQGRSPVAPGLPPTITGERSVASRSGPAWAGPTPLTDLLKP